MAYAKPFDHDRCHNGCKRPPRYAVYSSEDKLLGLYCRKCVEAVMDRAAAKEPGGSVDPCEIVGEERQH